MEINPLAHAYHPADPRLVDQIVYELKSQGIFDHFRKECIADVDTKPAYQNLRQRVEGNVSRFLKLQKWQPDMNKNQVREMLRKCIIESGYLESGVERIVDQVVNPKINSVFLSKVEDIVYQFLGIEKPNKEKKEPLKVDVDLLPNDLEAVSPESTADDVKDETEKTAPNNNDDSDMKIDEDESPPFEPLEPLQDKSGFNPNEENSIESQISAFSGLAGQEFGKSQMHGAIDFSQDSQMSQPSSESRLSIVTSEDNTKMEIWEDSMSKSLDKDRDEGKEKGKERVDKERDREKDKNRDRDKRDKIRHTSSSSSNDKDKHRSRNNDRDKDRKSSSKDNRDKYRHSSSSSSKDRDRKDSKSYKSSENDKKDDKDRNRDRDKDKDKEKSKRDGDEKSRDKDREKDKSSSSRRDEKDKNRSKSDKDRNDRDKDKRSSSSKHSRDKSSSNSSKDKTDRSDKEKSDREKDRHDRDHKEKDKDRNDKGKERSEKDKDRLDKNKDRSEKDKTRIDRNEKEKDRPEKSKDRSDKQKEKPDKDKTDKEKSDKDKNEKDKDKSKNDKDKSDKRSSSTSSNNNSKRKLSHTSSNKDKNSIKKSKKDDHYSSKEKKSDRRSTDRDSNDGNNHSSNRLTKESNHQSNSSKKSTSSINSTSKSESQGNSDGADKMKVFKPKLASNLKEAMKLKKLRKQLAQLEKNNALRLSDVPLSGKVNGIELDLNIVAEEEEKRMAQPNQEKIEEQDEVVENKVLSQEKWEALEARLQEEMSNVKDYESLEDDDNKNDESKEMNVSETEVAEKTDNAAQSSDSCKYLEKPTDTLEKNLEYLNNFVNKLEMDVKETSSDSNRKRKSEEDNNNKKNNAKRSKRNSVMSTTSAENLDLPSNNDNFPLPLSPVSDSSSIGNKKDDDSSKSRKSYTASQRYSSDDLYKPRPMFASSRRRGAKNTDN